MSALRFGWLAPFACFIIGYCLMGFLHKNETLLTPAIVGQSIEKALLVLSSHNLNIRIITAKDDPDLPEGTIISQTPAPGKLIKKNQALYVAITQKPAPLLIPSLENKTLDEIKQITQQLPFTTKLFPIPTDLSTHLSLAQCPQAHEKLLDNTLIVYYSQPANKPVIMPNFKDKKVEDVVNFLSLQGITPTILHTNRFLEPHHDCKYCIVTDQRPLAGSLVTLLPDKPIQIQLQVG